MSVSSTSAGEFQITDITREYIHNDIFLFSMRVMNRSRSLT